MASLVEIGGAVTEPVGVPVDGAMVTLVDAQGRSASRNTDAGGTYLMSAASGEYTLSASREGYRSASTIVRLQPQPSNIPVTVDLELVPFAAPADVGGAWTVTLRPAGTCPDFPGFDTRTYHASIVQSGASLAVTLSGPTFEKAATLHGTIHGAAVSVAMPGGCGYYCYGTPDPGPAVSERPAADQTFTVLGAFQGAAGSASIAGSLSGVLSLTQTTHGEVLELVNCYDQSHRLTFAR